jgi:hypothetical protein
VFNLGRTLPDHIRWSLCSFILSGLILLAQFTADQSNSYDCGVWVLTMVATVIFGCSYNMVTERSSAENGAYSISDMRSLLLRFCQEVPVHQ